MVSLHLTETVLHLSVLVRTCLTKDGPKLCNNSMPILELVYSTSWDYGFSSAQNWKKLFSIYLQNHGIMIFINSRNFLAIWQAICDLVCVPWWVNKCLLAHTFTYSNYSLFSNGLSDIDYFMNVLEARSCDSNLGPINHTFIHTIKFYPYPVRVRVRGITLHPNKYIRYSLYFRLLVLPITLTLYHYPWTEMV